MSRREPEHRLVVDYTFRYGDLSSPRSTDLVRTAINITGAWAEISGPLSHVLETTLRFKHPNARYNKAFKEKRWDGKVALYQDRRFPAGLTNVVIKAVNDLGEDVHIREAEDAHPLDPEKLPRDILPGIKLWDHQFDAARAAVPEQRGIIKVPTGGGKTEIACALGAFFWYEREWPTLVVVPKKGLLHQTVDRFRKYLDPLGIDVGCFGDSIRERGVVNIGTASTLQGFRPRKASAGRGKSGQSRILPTDPIIREMLRATRVLMLDECHRASSDTWYDVALFCEKATRRYGLSGTPLKNAELADMRMMGATGPIFFEVGHEVLTEQGLASKPKIVMVMTDETSGPPLPTETVMKPKRGGKNAGAMVPRVQHLPYAQAYREGIIENEHLNQAAVTAAAWCVEHKRQTLVLCRRKDHFRLLDELLAESGVRHLAVWGDTDIEDRDEAKRALNDGDVDVVLATTIWDEGEDIQNIGAVVLAEGVKSVTSALQRIGRGMRGAGEVWVVDFVPTCHPRLHDHAAERARAYEGEGYDVFVQETWNLDDPNLLPFEQWDEVMSA